MSSLMRQHGTWQPRNTVTSSMIVIQLPIRKMKKAKKLILIWSKLKSIVPTEWLIDCSKTIKKILWNSKFFRILTRSGKIWKLKLQKKLKFIRNQSRTSTKLKRTVLNIVWKRWKKKSLCPRRKALNWLASSRVIKSTNYASSKTLMRRKIRFKFLRHMKMMLMVKLVNSRQN